jgi:hypothetical protein
MLSEFSQFDMVVKFNGPEKTTTLFPKGTRLGQKKRISLKYADDLSATIFYNISNTLHPIVEYNVTGLTAIKEKHEDVEMLHNYFIFLLDLSGISGLIEAEAKFNTTVERTVKKSDAERLANRTLEETLRVESLLLPPVATEQDAETEQEASEETVEETTEEDAQSTDEKSEDQEAPNEQEQIDEPEQEPDETTEEPAQEPTQEES